MENNVFHKTYNYQVMCIIQVYFIHLTLEDDCFLSYV